MKDQATHIRLIRDDNGKPVEAEYHVTEPLRRYKDQIAFRNWADASRIPVTGDWPTDKNVFAKDEVEPVECVEPTSKLYMWRNYTALRLKATLSDNGVNLSKSTPLSTEERDWQMEDRLTDVFCDLTTEILDAQKYCEYKDKFEQFVLQEREAYKQQYQQEIIEKITERINGLNWHGDDPDPRHSGLKLALHIIQSTK